MVEEISKNFDRTVKVVTDLINGLVEILRLETEELQDAARQAFEPVEPWDEG